MKRVLVIIFTCLWILSATGKNEELGGLKFGSYDKNKDERTSLSFPCDQQPLKINEYLKIEFDFRIEPTAEPYGYICRLIADQQWSLDLLLNNPPGALPFLCLIKGSDVLLRIDNINLSEWSRIKIELTKTNNNYCVRINGADSVDIKASSIRNMFVRFGANEVKGFRTSDVAPFTIKNLSLSTKPNKDEWHWCLNLHNKDGYVYDQNKGEALETTNAQWLIDNHIHWKHENKILIPSKCFMVKDADSARIFLITKNTLYTYDLKTNRIVSGQFNYSIPTNMLVNQFIFDKYNNHIIYYNFNADGGIHTESLNINNYKWSDPLNITQKYAYLHNSKTISPTDSSLIQLFGYGYHEYHSDFFRHSQKYGFFRQNISRSISPRYLSSIGINDNYLYVYGGVGNNSGNQEYGIHSFSDLYRINLNDYSIEKLWAKDNSDDEIAIADLIIEDNGGSIKSLFFTPTKFATTLTLREFSSQSDKFKKLADEIPYLFLDIHSEVNLIESTDRNKLFATTLHKNPDNTFEVNIYSVDTPVLASEDVFQDAPRRYTRLIITLCLVLLFLAAMTMRIIRRKSLIPDININEEHINHMLSYQNPTTAGIFLLNGFKIVSRNLDDITAEFTPVMKQLLLAIILFTQRNGKGASNDELRELLWNDKSEESARNNRSVNIRKLRLLLAESGYFEIENKNGFWRFKTTNKDHCDYVSICNFIAYISTLKSINQEQFDKLIETSSNGVLLSHLHYDWLDPYKADYSDAIISTISTIRDSTQFTDNNKAIVLLCEAILRFDSLDETSVKRKCMALISLKRIGTAKSTFDNFVKEYNNIMGETYQTTFEKFVQ